VGHRNNPRGGIPLLQGQTGRAGAVQPKEEKALGRPDSRLLVCKVSYKKEEDRLFSRVSGDRTRGNDFKLKEGIFILDIGKKFFTVRVVRHWNRLSRDVVDALSLGTLKDRLDGALSNPI